MRKNQNFFSTNAGFTLVELAVVMIIIGLLIGGVLKGQELILNAKIKNLVQNINAYRSAVLTFEDSYHGIPGDLVDPGAKLPGCLASPNCIPAGGNGDGYIGTPKIADWSVNDQSALNSEPTQFWVHLQLADLVSGITGINAQEWGAAYPSSPLGGGFQVLNANEVGANRAIGHYFYWRFNPTGIPHPFSSDLAVISPSLLSRIDRKFDDGLPNTGSIIADDVSNTCWTVSTVQYIEADVSKTCIAAFKF